MTYRVTPLPWCKLSPAEILMEYKHRTNIPQTRKNLTPHWSHIKKYKKDQKHQFDQ